MPRYNPKWKLARQIASEMQNETDSNIKRILKELKTVRADALAMGCDDDDVVEAWRWVRTREVFPIPQARITTVLTGSPAYLRQWSDAVLDEMPSVVFTADFDDYCRRNAKWLSKRHFRYQWPNEASQTDGSRMTYSEAKELGLTE
jgi:hypothetical protein